MQNILIYKEHYTLLGRILIHVQPMVILGHNDVTLDGWNYLLPNYMQRHIDYKLFQTYM